MKLQVSINSLKGENPFHSELPVTLPESPVTFDWNTQIFT